MFPLAAVVTAAWCCGWICCYLMRPRVSNWPQERKPTVTVDMKLDMRQLERAKAALVEARTDLEYITAKLQQRAPNPGRFGDKT
jgi:hypothetical protein